MSHKRFKRFETPELILHWINGIPFIGLLMTGALMLGSRFFNMDRGLFHFLQTSHKTLGATWLIGLGFTFLFIDRKKQLENLRAILTWSSYDADWIFSSIRSLYNKNISVPESPKFNTGQKINCLLVIGYYFGFGLTGLSMWFYGSILVSWYFHASLFFAALPSVGGHLYLSFINPSTRIGLAGIFHGWVPLHYVEHHHSLELSYDLEEEINVNELEVGRHDLSSSKAEIFFLAFALIMGGVGLKVFGMGRAAELGKNFDNVIRQQELSGKHNRAELADCNVCHLLSGEIKDENCEKCHPNIKERRDNKIGYHGILTGRCMNCHKEHPELKGSIIPFDKDKFDHNLANFKRDGKHAKVECDKCHKQERKSGLGIYFTGLKYEFCTDCHQDRHNKQFKAHCARCHTTSGWQGQDLKFVHNNDSKFQLVGKHAKVECVKCHKPEKEKDPLGAAQFIGLKHECADCHDQHNNQFGRECLSCHTPNGWQGQELKFAHNNDSKVKFKLIGKHIKVECIKCHKPKTEKDALGTAQFRGLKTDCPDCHKDQHNGQFEKSCSQCHSPNGWQGENLQFLHGNDSKFQLAGKHTKVECIKCHKPVRENDSLGASTFRGLKTECPDCHKDQHNSQFDKSCSQCHTPMAWQGQDLKFSHTNDSKFQLIGKHLKVPCIKCHQPKTGQDPLGSALFKGLNPECTTCHQEPHRQEYGNNCTSCHTALAWPPKNPEFKHDQDTKFPLLERHATVKCLFCHSPGRVDRLGMEKIKGRDTYCSVCHREPHNKSLGEECNKCHSPKGWKGLDLLFRHNTHSRFKIDRNHIKVKCVKCHIAGKFKPIDVACEPCHPNYTGQNM